MDGIASTNHLVWRQRLAERKPGQPAHIYFRTEDARAFLHTLIASTTFDEEHGVKIYTADGKPAQVQTLEAENSSQEDDLSIEASANKVIDGFPYEAYEAICTLTTTERTAIRQDIRSVLLPINSENILADYLPIQILLEIIDAANDHDLFPPLLMEVASKYLFQPSIIDNYLEWILDTNISDFSTVYTLCLELTTILKTPELLKRFKQALGEHREVFIETWNKTQRVAEPAKAKGKVQKAFGSN